MNWKKPFFQSLKHFYKQFPAFKCFEWDQKQLFFCSFIFYFPQNSIGQYMWAFSITTHTLTQIKIIVIMQKENKHNNKTWFIYYNHCPNRRKCLYFNGQV